ncbi:DUF1361 domain-containing protein [Pleurocapsa sp. PCC 7319]|uniref:DUF1361 domain-containing protein n=1 Tax=Pleurocapsa sp. PCC 7319 TaxID=118161 RepID=UPI0003493B72|nr:DUF1361 domain-containing protein [Pleurocapsa sp. PCC 7319]
MESILADAFEAFNKYSGWIVWNLFLAFIPLILSFWLFLRPSKKRSLLWWCALITFIAFLPNAPYLLTDIIHLIEAIRAGYSIWITTLVFIPLHSLAIFIGWEAYVISLINQSHYLKKQGARKYIFASELITHALCAIGIFLGRFRRFNSWDLVTKPDILFVSTIGDLTAKKPLLVIAITWIILMILYWLTKQITLGTLLRIKLLLSKIDSQQELK